MIDIHSHIIPKIDDGSKSIKETFNMIKEAKTVGFTDIVMVSHFLLNYYEPIPQEIIFWRDKLQEIINDKIGNITLHTGMEIYISDKLEDFIELIKGNKLLNLANSRYMLIELPISTSINCLDYVLYFLQSNSIYPIIAHPERYKNVQENLELIDDYIDKGALIQCNYGSILGLYGKKAKQTTKLLLKKNKVNFLASDCHTENTIYYIIPEAVKKISKIIGNNKLYKLSTQNPKKILNNEDWYENGGIYEED